MDKRVFNFNIIVKNTTVDKCFLGGLLFFTYLWLTFTKSYFAHNFLICLFNMIAILAFLI